jgi:hypothetical protein
VAKDASEPHVTAGELDVCVADSNAADFEPNLARPGRWLVEIGAKLD